MFSQISVRTKSPILLDQNSRAPTGVGFLYGVGLRIVSVQSRAHLHRVGLSQQDTRLYVRRRAFGVGHLAIRSRASEIGHPAISSKAFGVEHRAMRSRAFGIGQPIIRLGYTVAMTDARLNQLTQTDVIHKIGNHWNS